MVKFSDLSVGMTVVLRNSITPREEYAFTVTTSMRKYFGKEVTITTLDDETHPFPIFYIEEDRGDCYWAVELIDHIVVEEELPTISGDPLSFLA